MITYLPLSLVTHIKKTPIHDYKEFLKKAIKGGVTSVQFRHQDQNKKELFNLATEIQATLKTFKIPLIINDYLDLAKKIDADGIHLGQSDVPPIIARKHLGPNKIIGWSVETFDELEQANQMDYIDYIGASAVFFSKTKPGCKTLWGLEGLKKLAELSRHPIVAIGGINISNVESVINIADGVAVIGAIHDYADAFQATKNLAEKIQLSIIRKRDEKSNRVRP